MRFQKSIAFLSGALSLSLFLQPVQAGEPGTSGFLSLKLGSGARASAMGDAQVSLARDATAMYWNPSGLATIDGTSFALQHTEWFQTIRLSAASIGHATDYGVFGVHFLGMYMDEIPKVETAAASPIGNFNVYEVSFAVGYALRLKEDWDIGVAVKGLNSKLDETSAWGWAVDAGVQYRTKIEGLTFAAVAQHLGPDVTFIADPFKLPATGRIGADYQRNLFPDNDLLLAYDLEIANDARDPRNHFGVEYTYHQMLSLRMGYKTGFESQNVSFGAGLRRNEYSFSYAYLVIDNDLGDSHRFSLGIDL
jgi:hypothetical protein